MISSSLLPGCALNAAALVSASTVAAGSLYIVLSSIAANELAIEGGDLGTQCQALSNHV